MLSHNAFIIVADGSSAHLYRNSGHDTITLQLLETITPHSLTHDEGLRGHAPIDQSPKDHSEATFITQLVNKLNALALAHALPDEVVVVADPTSLGHMRPLYHAELKRRVTRELHKTMIRATPQELAAALAKP